MQDEWCLYKSSGKGRGSNLRRFTWHKSGNANDRISPDRFFFARSNLSRINSTGRKLVVFLISLIVVYCTSVSQSALVCYSFGKRTGGSARRPNECFVLEPSEMIVVSTPQYASRSILAELYEGLSLYILLTVAFNPLFRCCSYMRFFPYKF